jgi:hypothetical protein
MFKAIRQLAGAYKALRRISGRASIRIYKWITTFSSALDASAGVVGYTYNLNFMVG